MRLVILGLRHDPAHLELLSEYQLTNELKLSPESGIDVGMESDDTGWGSER